MLKKITIAILALLSLAVPAGATETGAAQPTATGQARHFYVGYDAYTVYEDCSVSVDYWGREAQAPFTYTEDVPRLHPAYWAIQLEAAEGMPWCVA